MSAVTYSIQVMAIYRAICTIALCTPLLALARADQEYAIKENAYACTEARQMNLWDLSSSSPLIRHEMLSKNYCWRAMPGMKVVLIERVGKFARVHFPAGNNDFFLYAEGIRKWTVADSQPPAATPTLTRDVTGLYRVENSSDFGVTLINKKPTVTIVVSAGPNLRTEFTVVKTAIRNGYKRRITNQRDSEFQSGGYLGKRSLGLGDGVDYAQIHFISVDPEKRLAEVEVEGHWDIPGTEGVTLRPGRVKISGKNFTDLVRDHTVRELSRVIE